MQMQIHIWTAVDSTFAAHFTTWKVCRERLNLKSRDKCLYRLHVKHGMVLTKVSSQEQEDFSNTVHFQRQRRAAWFIIFPLILSAPPKDHLSVRKDHAFFNAAPRIVLMVDFKRQKHAARTSWCAPT